MDLRVSDRLEEGRESRALLSDPKAPRIIEKLESLSSENRPAAFLLMNEISDDLESVEYDLVQFFTPEIFQTLFEMMAYHTEDSMLAITTTWSNARLLLTVLRNSDMTASILTELDFVPFLVNQMAASDSCEFQTLCVTIMNEMLEREASVREHLCATEYLHIISEMPLSDPVFTSWVLLITKPEFSCELSTLALAFLLDHSSEPVTSSQMRVWKILLKMNPEIFSSVTDAQLQPFIENLWLSMTVFLKNCIYDLGTCYHLLSFLCEHDGIRAYLIEMRLPDLIRASLHRRILSGKDLLAKQQTLKDPHERILKHSCRLIYKLIEYDSSLIMLFTWVATPEFLDRVAVPMVFHTKVSFCRLVLLFGELATDDLKLVILSAPVLESICDILSAGGPEAVVLLEQLQQVATTLGEFPELEAKVELMLCEYTELLEE